MSTFPEIPQSQNQETRDKALPTNSSTAEMADNQQKSDPIEAPKQDSANISTAAAGPLTKSASSEISEEEKALPAASSPQTTTTEMSDNQQKSNQIEAPAPKQDSASISTPVPSTKTVSSGVPEEDKALPAHSSPQSTTEMTANQQKSDQIEAPKQDSANVTTSGLSTKPVSSGVPEEEKPLPAASSADQETAETTANQQKFDQIETPKQDSASISKEPSADESPMKESTPRTEIPKQDPSIIAPQAGEKTDNESSKRGFTISLPLPDVLNRSKDKKPEPTSTPPSANIDDAPPKKPSPQEKAKKEKEQLFKIIDADINYIEKESNRLSKYKEHLSSLIDDAKRRFEDLKKVGTEKELRELKNDVIKLKLQIPSKHKDDVAEKDTHKGQQGSKIRRRALPELVMKQMPQLHRSDLFGISLETRDFKRLFHELDARLKLCLLCFSIFPEKAIVKKRLMVYWWIAEGFVPPVPRDDETREQSKNGKTAEEFADEVFEKLTKMGFIEPVHKKRSLSVRYYTMHRFVRLALIMMAEEEKFFNFDAEGVPTEKSSGTFQLCLMGRGLIDYLPVLRSPSDLPDSQSKSNRQDSQSKSSSNLQDLEKLHAVFNINEPILDFRLEWFLRMKNLNVLNLGRWRVIDTDHIEIEDTRFLDALKNMDQLRFLSLQGVSNIMVLPDSISQLSSLIILDVRACHSLESIPEGIRFLGNLTYMDISECYLMEHMPKGLAMLANLKVFKGFVVGEEQGRHTCTLEDLAKLEKLIKLGIYTRLKEFPDKKHLDALQNFKALKRLAVEWGGKALQADNGGGGEQTREEKEEKTKEEGKKGSKQALQRSISRLVTFKGVSAAPIKQLTKLEKLDLIAFPKTATLDWLRPSSLKSLKKLYIRGGKFTDLGQYQNQEFDPKGGTQVWTSVETLRLKYLSELEMDWKQLQELFPGLSYLEKVSCPKLSFFPCDGYGVWTNKQKQVW